MERLAPAGIVSPPTNAGSLATNLITQLETFTEAHSPNLVIIDTFQRIREDDGPAYSYKGAYAAIKYTKDFAYRYGVCVLLVHHTRKQDAHDVYDQISGTTGLWGGAGGAMIMQKPNQTSIDATVEVTDHEQGDQKLYLEKDSETLLWSMTKAEVDLHSTPRPRAGDGREVR